MIRAIIAGSLTRAPEEKLSKGGHAYTKATIREGSGDKTRWVTAFVFADEAREALSGMAAGDAISVAGEIEAEIFTPEGGQPRISWSVKVDAVLTAKSGARKRNAEPRESRNPAPINDDIPF